MNSDSGDRLAQPGPEAARPRAARRGRRAARPRTRRRGRERSCRRARTRRSPTRPSDVPAPGIAHFMNASTSGRGAICRRPSSGRTQRRYGAQRRSRSHAIAGVINTRPRVRSGAAEAELERHPAAHAVPDEVGALELERVEQLRDAARLELRPVGGPERLVGVAEAEQVDGDRPERRRQRRHRRQERGLVAAEPVQHQDRRAGARLERRVAARLGRDPPEAKPPGPFAPDVAARKPTPRWRFRRTRRRPRRNASMPLATSAAISSQVAASAVEQRVGVAAAPRSQPRARASTVTSQARPFATRREADHRPLPGQIERVVVEAIDQFPEGCGRSGCAGRGLAGLGRGGHRTKG